MIDPEQVLVGGVLLTVSLVGVFDPNWIRLRSPLMEEPPEYTEAGAFFERAAALFLAPVGLVALVPRLTG